MKYWGTVLGLGVLSACGSAHDGPARQTAGRAGADGGGASGKAGAGAGRSGGGGAPNGAIGGGGGTTNAGHGGTGTHRGGSQNGGNGNTGNADEGGALETGGASSGGTTGGNPNGGGASGANDDAGSMNEAGGASGAGGGTQGVTLNVHTAQNVHRISPLIYGVNRVGSNCSNAAARFTLCRLGGTRWSTYDWETNASNSGADENQSCFENDAALGGADVAGAAVTNVVDEAHVAGAATLVTLPIIDYVAADEAGGSGPPDCTGDVRKTGADYLDTRFKLNAPVKGSAFVYPPDTTDASVYSDEFVAFLRGASAGADVLFALDNQPGLWGVNVAAAHPSAPTYAEVVARNVAFAKSTRDQWPAAEISGYVGYGYADFVNLQGATDAANNGLFMDYYLSSLSAASASYGGRLLDYLDVHWFPEIYVANVRITENDSSDASVRARVQAPRSLWDSTYVEESWITADANGGQPIRLLPWLEEHIAAHYAGTKLAISEWSYGGGTDVSGAIAAADALGAFGREDVGLAAFASDSGADPFVVGAFQMFRNYDGAGASFGDTSVAATSSNPELASVYASIDSSASSRVVLIAINRSDAVLPVTLSVDDPHSFTTAEVYTLTAASPTPSPASPLSAMAGNVFAYDMPAYSISVVVPKP